MGHDTLAAWRIAPEGYPAGASPAERLRFLVRYAVLAPSSHNTQPWRFKVEGDSVALYADRTRALPVVDPHDRALVISCGAALGLLRCAIRRFGAEALIAPFPDPGDSDLLARVRIGGRYAPLPAEVRRFEAITARRTTRLRFADEPLSPALAAELRRLAGAVELKVVEDAAGKAAIAGLVAEGDLAQFADPAFRRELGAWVHSRAGRGDGMSGAAFGMPDALSAVGGLVIRTFDMGDGLAAKDEAIAAGSPALLVFATKGDAPGDWLAVGMAHADVLLEVAAGGLTAAYLNQPVEVAALRPRLKRTAGLQGVPQLLLRIGRGRAVTPAARRPLDEVLIA